jgi:beta-glucosidase
MIHKQHLKSLVEGGEVPVERIDDAALRVLRQQIRFAQGRDPHEYSLEVVSSEAHRKIAREAAEKAIVLLKNEGALLPLKEVKKLVVIGKLAAVPNTGDGGSSNTRPPYVITPLQGLQEALEGQAEIIYDDGSNPARSVQVARKAEVVVPRGGDRKLLTLHPDDEALIQAVAASNPRTVVAMMGGSAIITENWRRQVPAILMLWYPGMEGGRAFADILLGKVNPSGKLPCVFATRPEDLPYYDVKAKAITYDLWHGYRKLERDGAVPAFPFGFGMSYTTFEFDHLRLSDKSLSANDTLTATLEVTNRGPMAGDTVVQVYIAVPASRVERAPKELKAFRRVGLKSGETKTIQVDIPAKDLAYYDEQSGWTVEPTSYRLIVGQHSLDEQALQAEFKIA